MTINGAAIQDLWEAAVNITFTLNRQVGLMRTSRLTASLMQNAFVHLTSVPEAYLDKQTIQIVAMCIFRMVVDNMCKIILLLLGLPNKQQNAKSSSDQTMKARKTSSAAQTLWGAYRRRHPIQSMRRHNSLGFWKDTSFSKQSKKLPTLQIFTRSDPPTTPTVTCCFQNK